MRNMASLLSKPMTPAPPDDDASGGEPAGSGGLQSLMGQGGQQQGGAPAPNYEQTVRALNHLTAFEREWKKILADPGAGKKDIKGTIMESIAELMGDQYITLAQSMSLLKDLPTTPLEQKQWAQEHLQKDMQAQTTLLMHHAAAFPRGPMDPPQPRLPHAGHPRAGGHSEMMAELVNHYKSRAKKGR